MKSFTPSLHFSLSIFAGALLIGGSIIYATQKDTLLTSNLDANLIVQDELNRKYIVKKEEPIKVTIVNDSSCDACNTEQLEAVIKQQIGRDLAVRRLDVSDNEAKSLIAENQIRFLPFILVDTAIEDLSNIEHLTHHLLTKSGKGYMADLLKMGVPVGRYLDVTYYEKEDPSAPKIVVQEKEYDFGTVSLFGGKVSTEFVVRNEGKSPLEFLNANTSCGCTSTQIMLPDATSPEYKMAGHQAPISWRGSLAPGEEGKLIVYYDPTVHPDLDEAVTRLVTINTNDPKTPQLELKIHAKQTPQ